MPFPVVLNCAKGMKVAVFLLAARWDWGGLLPVKSMDQNWHTECQQTLIFIDAALSWKEEDMRTPSQ